MRRADRLFQIVQILRRGRVTTAARLAAEIEVSERTVYRDVADLIANGVPIEGEAGVGYVLPPSFDLPPLMFDAQEIEALVVGARMVSSWADPALSRAAVSALTKVEQVLPARLRDKLASTRVYVPDFHVPRDAHQALTTVRAALEGSRVLVFDYQSESGERTHRRVRPLGVFFWGRTWTLAAWCETRSDFRTFRVDRITAARASEETFVATPGRALEDYLASVAEDAERPTSVAERPASAAKRPSSIAPRSPSDATPSTPARTTESTPTKPPKLELDDDERRLLRAAGVRAIDVAGLGVDGLSRRVDGALSRARCAELVSLADFQRLGSVGLASARDFLVLGLGRVTDLVGRDPIELYHRLEHVTGHRHDPCVEDVMRCAVAQAEDPDLPVAWRDWWHWTPLRAGNARRGPTRTRVPQGDARGLRSARYKERMLHTALRRIVLFILVCSTFASSRAFASTTPTGESPATAILDGVHAIATVGTPGVVAVFGPEAFPLVVGRVDAHVRAPVVAAGEYGSGRVVAFAHTGYFSPDALSKLDGARFLANAVRWASHRAKGTVRVGVSGGTAEFTTFLGAQGFEAQSVASVRGLDPDKTDVLFLIGGDKLGAEDQASLASFVQRGGGLFVAQTPWGWMQLNPNRSLATDHAHQALLAKAGLAWVDGTVDETAPGAFAVGAISELVSASRALETLLRPDAAKITREQASQARWSLLAPLSVLSRDDKVLRPAWRSCAP